MFFRRLNISVIYIIVPSILLFFMTSCAQKGCPGGMCNPSHYYSSPKSIFSFGNGNTARRGSKGYTVRKKIYIGKSRRIVRRIEYDQMKNWTPRQNPGKMERSAFGSGRAGSNPSNIQKRAFKDRKPSQYAVSIERNPLRNSGSGFGGSNIEGDPFAQDAKARKKASRIEGTPFTSDGQQKANSNIERDPFKVSRSARLRTAEIHRSIKYKEKKQKQKDQSQYGLFPPEVEGWETREAPTSRKKRENHKKPKEGHGTKNPDNDLIK